MKILLMLLWIGPVAAQETPSAAPTMRVDPGKDKKAIPKTALGLALASSFKRSTWEKVGISTTTPAADMDRLLAAGFYRLELVQLILLADQLGARLSELTIQRRKVKKTLREIAESAHVDYDAFYEDSLKTAERVQRRADALSRVRVLVKEKP
jgi:hypothetical protein